MKNQESGSRSVISALLSILSILLFFTGSASAELFTSYSSGGQSSVIAGTNINYEFSVFNDTGLNTTNTTLNVTLPAGITHVANTSACDTSNPLLVSCNLGTVLNGDSAPVSITLHVADDYVVDTGGAGFVSFSATATSTEVPAANTVLGDTPVTELADLRVTNIAQEPILNAGEVQWYTIYVDNFGPSAARNVAVVDTLLNSNDPTDNIPDTLSIQSCAFSVSQGGGSITQFTCTTGPLVQTQFGTDIGTFRTNVLRVLTNLTDDPTTPEPDDAINYGRLRGTFRMVANDAITLHTTTRVISLTPDPDETNNLQVEVFGAVAAADLTLDIDSSGEVQPANSSVLPYDLLSGAVFPEAGLNTSNIAVTAGRRVKYSYTVTNNGPSQSNNSSIISRLPAGIVVVPGSLEIKNKDGSAAAANCQFGTPGLPSDEMTCGFGTIVGPDNDANTNENNLRTVEFEVMSNANLGSGTVLVNNVLLGSDDADPDNGDNLGSSLMVVSPLTGISDCSVGGPYSNVICGNGTAVLDLNGFGFALPDTGSLDVQWSTNCPGAAFDDATVVNPTLSFTTANPDNSPVSCQVDLSVQNAFASSACSGIVNVINCAADCFGVLDGPAELDRCGVCEGDGQSCLGCSEVDSSGSLFNVSSAAVTLRNGAFKAARQLSDLGAKRLVKRAARRAFLANLEALTRVPSKIKTCTNSAFCVQSSNITILDDVSSGLDDAFAALNSAVKRLKKQGGSPAALKALLKRGKAALASADAALVTVPLTSSSCI